MPTFAIGTLYEYPWSDFPRNADERLSFNLFLLLQQAASDSYLTGSESSRVIRHIGGGKFFQDFAGVAADEKISNNSNWTFEAEKNQRHFYHKVVDCAGMDMVIDSLLSQMMFLTRTG